MVAKYYDEEGNEVDVIEKEEVDKLLKEKEDLIKAKEEEKTKLSDEYEKNRVELDKLKSKDYNWRRLEEMNEEEKKQLTAREKELLTRQETIEKQAKEIDQRIIRDYQGEALDVLAGEDKDLREKILFHYDRIKDEAKSREDINRKMKDAYKLTIEKSFASNPILEATFSGRSVGYKKEERGKLTPELKELGKRMGLSDEDLKDK
jgi:hypothetical protein